MSAINFALSELLNKHNTDTIHKDITKFIQKQYSKLSEFVNYEDIKSFLNAVQKVHHAKINYDTVLTVNNILKNISFCVENVNKYKENDWYIQNFVKAYANLSIETRNFLKNEYTILSFNKLKTDLENCIRLEMFDVQKYYNVLIDLYNDLCKTNPPDKKQIQNVFSHSFKTLHSGNTTKLVNANDYIEYSFFENLLEKISEYVNKSNINTLNIDIHKNISDNSKIFLTKISKFIKKDILDRYKKTFILGYRFYETLELYNNINMFIEVMTKYEIKQLDDQLEDTLLSKGYSRHNNYEIALIINKISQPKQILILAKIIIILSIIYTNDEFQLNINILHQLKIKPTDVFFMNVLSLFAISVIAIDHDAFKRHDSTCINMSSQEIGDNFAEIKFILVKLNNMNNIKQFNNFLNNRKIHTLTKTHLTDAHRIFDANLETSALNQLYLDKNFNNSDFLHMVNNLKYLESKNINILLQEANPIFCINNNNRQTYAEILEIIINMDTDERVKYFWDRIDLFQQDDMSNAAFSDRYFFIILKMFFNVTKALQDFWDNFDLDLEVLKIMNHSCSENASGYSDIPVYCDLSGDIDKKFEHMFSIYRDALAKQKQIILDNLLSPIKGNFLDYDYLYRHFSRHLYLEKYLNLYNIICQMDEDPNFLSKITLFPEHANLLRTIHNNRINSIIKNLALDPQYLAKLGIDKYHIDSLLNFYINKQNINLPNIPLKNIFIPFFNRVNNNNSSFASRSKSIDKSIENKNSESSIENNIETKISADSIGYKENCEKLRQSHEPDFYA